ncbi:MAG: nuclear transport factor 2 family protein, partial [Microbacterium sp.]|uniref:nuclear transport factor 2 family protein n=1 Tax=Microbacterium sp. TaxID=51671 RepID=UPI003D6E2C28
RMRACFSPDYLMWNLNGHPYYGLEEKVALFRYYKQHMVPTEPPELWDIRVTVDQDMAYVTSQGVLPLTVASEEGSGSAIIDAALPHYERRGDTVRFRFRETSVLRRDDGHGNPTWRIWHFHCSPLAPVDEARPGPGDTAAERGTQGPVEVMGEQVR